MTTQPFIVVSRTNIDDYFERVVVETLESGVARQRTVNVATHIYEKGQRHALTQSWRARLLRREVLMQVALEYSGPGAGSPAHCALMVTGHA